MEWLEITINDSGEGMDSLVAHLCANGMDQLIIESGQDFQHFLAEKIPHWDYIDKDLVRQMEGASKVRFYVSDDPDGRSLLAQYLKGLEDHEVLIAPVQDEDWSFSWQKYYCPVSVGQRLYIVPGWEQDAPVPPEKIRILLNPGLAFGTGNHASTQLCLELLDESVQKGDHVLDLGCGSGILSLASLRLGASFAEAVDIDPVAVESAQQNACLNAIEKNQYHITAGDILTDPALRNRLGSSGPYQIVLANIVADVIIRLAPYVPSWMSRHAVFICSGILTSRLPEVDAALVNSGFSVQQQMEKDDWYALCCCLR